MAFGGGCKPGELCWASIAGDPGDYGMLQIFDTLISILQTSGSFPAGIPAATTVAEGMRILPLSGWKRRFLLRAGHGRILATSPTGSRV